MAIFFKGFPNVPYCCDTPLKFGNPESFCRICGAYYNTRDLIIEITYRNSDTQPWINIK